MIIGIPIWTDRISPVLDTALKLLVVDTQNGQEISRKFLDFPPLHPMHRAGFIASAGIEVVICGALSRPLEQMLVASGIEVYPYVTGNVERVIAAFSNGELDQDHFILPGCRGRRGRGRMRWRQGRRVGFGYEKHYKEGR